MLLLVYPHLGDSWESAREGLTSRLLCFTTGFPGAPKGSPLQLFSLCSNLCIGAVSILRYSWCVSENLLSFQYAPIGFFALVISSRPVPLHGLGSQHFACGINFSPHSGHSTRSVSTRLNLSGGIEYPHFVQTVSREARTLARLIFCLLTIIYD